MHRSKKNVIYQQGKISWKTKIPFYMQIFYKTPKLAQSVCHISQTNWSEAVEFKHLSFR